MPAYGGAAITSIVPTLVGGHPPVDVATWLPEPVRDAKSVVVILLDGLGWRALDARRDRLVRMASLTGGPITTVVPSTTASALTSLATGLAPSQHGVVGYRMRVDGGVLNVLRWRRTDSRRPPDPFSVQRHQSFAGRPVPVVTKREFERTGFTEAHLRGVRFVGWHEVSTLVEHVSRLVGAGERFVYAYYPGIDGVAHEYGLHDSYYEAELAFADELVGRLLDALPASAALVVTSDHGQVHFGRDWIELTDVDPLVDAYAGDGRFRYLYARRGAVNELCAEAQRCYGDRAWVWSREQLLDEGWLGPGPVSGGIRRRLGDVVLAAREPVAFVDPTLPTEAGLLAGHGSVTPDEMLVPFVAGRGVGR
ncbi:MAG TPA: alkaline phosphatase family protein [Acidimicrobiia bacterium]|nr:alkaline phosphatase family protein [Acidimicrobiia bacterium]